MNVFKKLMASFMEYLFFIVVMFMLFYMVACLARVFFIPMEEPPAKPFDEMFLVSSAEGEQARTTLPASFDVPDTAYMTAESVMPEEIVSGEYLAYYSSFQKVKVYIDGVQRGESNGSESFFQTDVPANRLSFIELSAADAGKPLMLTYESPLYNYKGLLGRMCIGEKKACTRYMFHSRVPVVLVGMFVFFFGLLLLGVGLSKEAHIHINRIYKLLGFAGIFMGAWFVLQSCICQIFFSDVSWVHWAELMCFVFLPVPLLFFMDECTHGLYWNLIQPICIASLAFTIMSLVLTLGGYDAMRFIILIHMLMVITILFALWILADIYRTRRDLFQELHWVVAGFAGFFASAIVEGAQFYLFPRNEEGTVLAVGVAAFFLCNYVWLQKQRVFYMAQEQKEKQKARTKNLFLANMSHEIRTPVNTILITNAMISQESKDPKIRSLAKDALLEGKKLLALINDILDYSKITSHHMVVEPSNYDMVWFLRDLYRLGEKYHEDAPFLEFSFHCNPQLPSYLYGDEAKIRRMMENLLRMAFRQKDCSKIRLIVDYKLLQPDEALLLLSVEDDGPGVGEEQQQQILDTFSDKLQSEGFDVELSLVDGILRLMDGEFEYSSEADLGTKVTLRIPQQVVELQAIGEQNAASVEHTILLSRDTTRHVLMVDDEEMNHRIFKEILRGEKVDISDAYSGEEALNLVTMHRYDIIFMDNYMDGISGMETAEQMVGLAHSRNLDTPVILLSASGVTGQELQEHGFSGYIQKPMARQDVFRALKTLEEGGYDVQTEIYDNENKI